jgi:hypothetical protein
LHRDFGRALALAHTLLSNVKLYAVIGLKIDLVPGKDRLIQSKCIKVGRDGYVKP